MISIKLALEKSKSISGKSLPKRIINAIIKLEHEKKEYSFRVGSLTSFSKGVEFFKENFSQIIFIDKEGSITSNFKENEVFVGIYLIPSLKVARIYAYFPKEIILHNVKN